MIDKLGGECYYFQKHSTEDLEDDYIFNQLIKSQSMLTLQDLLFASYSHLFGI